MKPQVKHLSVRKGYDLWAKTYDQIGNPLVALDDRYTLNFLAPQPGEWILDAACGTGRNLKSLLKARSIPVGLDFSQGMLQVARRHFPHLPLVQATLEAELPLQSQSFHAVLCALVGEHLKNLRPFFSEMFRILKPGGRLIFSVFHPEMARIGIEANFHHGNTEYRLGAEKHSCADYCLILQESGFRIEQQQVFYGDIELVQQTPKAQKYLNKPLLLVLVGRRYIEGTPCNQ